VCLCLFLSACVCVCVSVCFFVFFWLIECRSVTNDNMQCHNQSSSSPPIIDVPEQHLIAENVVCVYEYDCSLFYFM